MKRKAIYTLKKWTAKRHIANSPQSEKFVYCAYRWMQCAFPQFKTEFEETADNTKTCNSIVISQAMQISESKHYSEFYEKSGKLLRKAMLRKCLHGLAAIPKYVAVI